MLFRLRVRVTLLAALALLLDATTTARGRSGLKRFIAGAMVLPTLLFNANVQIDPSYWSVPSQPPMTLSTVARADDELAKYAAEGNPVGVNGLCFVKKCALETSACALDQTCLKGLSCLARCKGGSMCSTGCFAKYGSDHLDNLLSCSVERNSCVEVPGKGETGWTVDKLSELPARPLDSFDLKSLEGSWFKIMGLDSRYDCFDCQKNSFQFRSQGQDAEGGSAGVLAMEALFRVPRPSYPGYLQSKVNEELRAPDLSAKTRDGSDGPAMASPDNAVPSMQSQGKMFGLTFWESWYILSEGTVRASPTAQVGLGIGTAGTGEPGLLAGTAGGERKANYGVYGTPAIPLISSIPPVLNSIPSRESRPPESDNEMKLVYYTGHTLQGSYKGAFLYARSPEVTPETLVAAKAVISRGGLNIADFCLVRNACFLRSPPPGSRPGSQGPRQETARLMASAAGMLSGAKSAALGSSNSGAANAAAAAIRQGQTEGAEGQQERKGEGQEPGPASKEQDAQPAPSARNAKVQARQVQYEMRKEGESTGGGDASEQTAPFWYVGQKFFRATETAARELSDWFEDPAILSDWLVQQQQRMVFQQPLEVSPFGGRFDEYND